MAVEPEVSVMVETRSDATPMESEAEVAGIGTVPHLKLLVAAAVVSLLVVGIVTLFFVLFRPIEEEATVELPTEEKKVEEKPVEEPTA
jgi:hypothetical protein